MDRADIKKSKKTLNILEIAATDKENLTSKIHLKKNINGTKTSLGKRNKKNVELGNRISIKNTNTIPNLAINTNRNKKDQSTQSASVLESDLTSDNPGENYWRNLAESCRKALDSVLKENVDLHNRVNELEYENSRLKSMLDEAKSLVEVLTEMIEDKPEEANGSNKKNSVLEEVKKEVSSDSELDDMSFQSCS